MYNCTGFLLLSVVDILYLEHEGFAFLYVIIIITIIKTKFTKRKVQIWIQDQNQTGTKAKLNPKCPVRAKKKNITNCTNDTSKTVPMQTLLRTVVDRYVLTKCNDQFQNNVTRHAGDPWSTVPQGDVAKASEATVARPGLSSARVSVLLVFYLEESFAIYRPGLVTPVIKWEKISSSTAFGEYLTRDIQLQIVMNIFRAMLVDLQGILEVLLHEGLSLGLQGLVLQDEAVHFPRYVSSIVTRNFQCWNTHNPMS